MDSTQQAEAPVPFSGFLASVPAASALRTAITAQYRAPEPDCVRRLVAEATLKQPVVDQAGATARLLVEALRSKGTRGPVQGLVREYDLSSQEGVALMCLAEALLRIPDRPTRDALIRDKISGGDWRSHLGHSPSLFVNAATWGLVLTGKLVRPADESGLSSALGRLVARGGEPVIRKGVDLAMRMMGEQFVTGQTIEDALRNSKRLEARGFSYSYDMLGEAAVSAEDAGRYYRDYEQAIHAIGRAAAGRGVYAGPGISIKLSALHPRYSRMQRERVMAELLPRVVALAGLARRYDIGLNIDAEEADRLELSLDLLEALCHETSLSGWNGIGFVVQAYQKRAGAVLDWVIDLARRSGHRLMVRLVKGAYWDSEIKRAQVDGLDDFPVFTRKIHTDVSYLACARKLLGAGDAVFPQFATHNAYTVAAVHAMAGAAFQTGQYEFQCLHGMGEPLYEEVVGPAKLNRPCRIYAPVGSHETLLAYLVRRLLENGANSSFVNRIQDEDVSVEELAADPVALVAAEQPVGAPHAGISLPEALFGAGRRNSAGLDLSNEQVLEDLAAVLAADGRRDPVLPGGAAREVRNPADHRDLVGYVADSAPAEIEAALARAAAAAGGWAAVAPAARAAILLRAADALEAEMPHLMALLIREAGKSAANAVAEVREAVDFLRYYAAQVRDSFDNGVHVPLGPVVCISPWNFPLAIFTGQVAAALAAGNVVLAKPAEETPLVARRAVEVLHAAGVPEDALQLVQGAGEAGARLVGDVRTQGVLFTGSTAVARLIQGQLAQRLNPDGAPVPLVAETGGQNALVADSSALAEQVVADVLVSAFDSAGQRCSALRVLCLQEDMADRVLQMLNGALAELAVGNPDRLSTDVGPVISAAAQDGILRHVAAMRAAGRAVHAPALPADCAQGTFVAPTVIEIASLAELTQEVFGPVLHVLRFRREGMDRLMEQVNATGYGLTFGVHSRIDATVARLTEQAHAGNIYVNRNLVGAVVGVQPFGGHGLSGTGPKAGGPMYLHRLLASGGGAVLPDAGLRPAAAQLVEWLRARGMEGLASRCLAQARLSCAGVELELPGPVGEENRYAMRPRGTVLCAADTQEGAVLQLAACLATGNAAGFRRPDLLPEGLAPGFAVSGVAGDGIAGSDAVLFEGGRDALLELVQAVAAADGAIRPVIVAQGGLYPVLMLVNERAVSTNTAAAGGNASLMGL